MAWLDSFVPAGTVYRPRGHRDPGFILPELRRKARNEVDQYVNHGLSSLSNPNLAGVPDANVLRRWKQTNGVIKALVQVRKAQISTAPWDVIVTTPNLPKYRQTDAERRAMAAKTMLDAPNVNAKNNSFAGLLGPMVDDLFVISQNGMVPTRNAAGQVASLSYVDGALINIRRTWKTPADGWRYVLLNGDRQTGKLLNNDQLICMVYEDVTYDEVGEPPLRTLQGRLQMMLDSLESVGDLQRNRAPATLLNFSGMDDQGLERMKRLIRNELLGVSTIGVFNYPLDGVEKMDLSNTNLQEMGVAWFMDFIVREACGVFMIPPSQIGWDQDTNRATAQVQLRVSLDAGVIPVMKMIAGYLNREVIASYGPDISFVWTELLSSDSPVDANVLAKQAGPIIYMSINDLRIAAGLAKIKVDEKDKRWPWFNEPFVPTGQGSVAPVSVAADMAEYQAAQVAAQTQQLGQQQTDKFYDELIGELETVSKNEVTALLADRYAQMAQYALPGE